MGGTFAPVNGATHTSVVQLSVNPGVTTGATADGSAIAGPQVVPGTCQSGHATQSWTPGTGPVAGRCGRLGGPWAPG
ncbi:MAG: hypothetical protein M3Y33_03915, partial [Actinomycetota bacterium]|nr:hypothetical protein [Actinomycetota bacterium]